MQPTNDQINESQHLIETPPKISKSELVYKFDPKKMDDALWLASPDEYGQVFYSFVVFADNVYTFGARYNRLYESEILHRPGAGTVIDYTSHHHMVAGVWAGVVGIVGTTMSLIDYDKRVEEKRKLEKHYSKVMEDLIKLNPTQLKDFNEFLKNEVVYSQERKSLLLKNKYSNTIKMVKTEDGSLQLTFRQINADELKSEIEQRTSEDVASASESENEKIQPWYRKAFLKFRWYMRLLAPWYESISIVGFAYWIGYIAVGLFTAAFGIGIVGVAPWIGFLVPGLVGLVYLLKALRKYLSNNYPEILSIKLWKWLLVTTEMPTDKSGALRYFYYVLDAFFIVPRMLGVLILIATLIYPIYSLYKSRQLVRAGENAARIANDKIAFNVKVDLNLAVIAAYDKYLIKTYRDDRLKELEKKIEKERTDDEKKEYLILKGGERGKTNLDYALTESMREIHRNKSFYQLGILFCTIISVGGGVQYVFWYLSDLFFPLSTVSLVGTIIAAIVALLMIAYNFGNYYETSRKELEAFDNSSHHKIPSVRASDVNELVKKLDAEWWQEFKESLWEKLGRKIMVQINNLTSPIYVLRLCLVAGTTVFMFVLVSINPITLMLSALTVALYVFIKTWELMREDKREFIRNYAKNNPLGIKLENESSPAKIQESLGTQRGKVNTIDNTAKPEIDEQKNTSVSFSSPVPSGSIGDGAAKPNTSRINNRSGENGNESEKTPLIS